MNKKTRLTRTELEISHRPGTNPAILVNCGRWCVCRRYCKRSFTQDLRAATQKAVSAKLIGRKLVVVKDDPKSCYVQVSSQLYRIAPTTRTLQTPNTLHPTICTLHTPPFNLHPEAQVSDPRTWTPDPRL